MSDTDDLLAALSPVAEAFGRLGVRFYVGGSVASTYHGAIRSTMDVDLVCDLSEQGVDRFVDAFGDDFYVSRSAALAAVRRASRFNLVHLPTSYKIDVFVSRGRTFDRMAMDRAAPHALAPAGGLVVPIATPEDSILVKLEWYRLSNDSSERQWDDVSRLVAIVGTGLDTGYIRTMAATLGITDLVDKLLGD